MVVSNYIIQILNHTKMSEHDYEITKVGDSTYLKIKIKHLIIAFGTLLTMLSAATGWIIRDYSGEFQERDQVDIELKESITKIDDNLDDVTNNVMFIRGQLGNVVRHDANVSLEPSTPSQTLPPSQ